MNDQVKKVLTDNVWNLATSANGDVNVAPFAFKSILPDGRLVIANNFMQKTVANIRANEVVSISAYDPTTKEGYQVKGKAVYTEDGPIADEYKKVVEERTHGALVCKGVVIIEVTKIYVTTPGANSGKEVE